MRILITADSATPEEVYNLTLAFQRTRHLAPLPAQLTVRNDTEPTPAVRVMGSAMTWESPYLDTKQARALLTEGYGALVTQSVYEVAVLDHLRGNNHDSSACAICTAERERDLETMRCNEIIGG